MRLAAAQLREAEQHLHEQAQRCRLTGVHLQSQRAAEDDARGHVVAYYRVPQLPPFGKSAFASAPRCACSAAPVSIRRPRSRVPRLGTRLGGLRLAVLRCVRPHCRAGVVPVHRPTARKMIQVVLAMTWSTNANNLTRYWDSKLLLDLTKLVGEAYLS